MTVQNVGDFETGLEDFTLEDAVVPRLQIVHKEGRFKDSLSNDETERVYAIMLGLVKQRILWHHNLDDGDWPMCRSGNHSIGFPNLSEDQPREKRFPWDKSGFRPEDYPAGEDGLIRLPCEGCALKEWKSHPDGKRPYCTEQFTVPVLYSPELSDDWNDYLPAMMTFQKTGLKPLKSYFTGFARAKTAAFCVVTEIGLTLQRKGGNDYSVPWFKKAADTDESNWREYSINYRTMKDFLEADPTAAEDDDDATAPSTNEAKPPEATKPTEEPADKQDIVDAQIVEDPPAEEPKKEEPKAEAKKEETKAAEPTPPTAEEDDDDLPF